MARKPDRFEQMVEALFARWGMPSIEHPEEKADLLRLLRHHHNAVRRMVKKQTRLSLGSQYSEGWNDAINRIILGLDAMKRGKP